MPQRILNIIILLLTLSCVGISGDEDPSSSYSGVTYVGELIKSFGSMCHTHGTWTSASLTEARKIQDILSFMRDDPRCADIAHSVAIHVDHLNRALGEMQSSSFMHERISGVERQQMDILQLLQEREGNTTTTYAYSTPTLERLFVQNQLSLAVDRGKLDFIEKRLRRERAASTIVQSVSKIFNQSVLNDQCLNHSPQFLSGLSAIGSTIAGSLSTGTAPLILASTSHLLGNAFEFFRKTRLNKQIAKLSQGEFVAAYQCVMESLSNQWCHAKETYDLIGLKMKETHRDPNIFLTGIKILNDDLPIFISWLRKINSASEPKNSSISIRQTHYLKRESVLKVWYSDSLGKMGMPWNDSPKVSPPRRPGNASSPP